MRTVASRGGRSKRVCRPRPGAFPRTRRIAEGGIQVAAVAGGEALRTAAQLAALKAGDDPSAHNPLRQATGRAGPPSLRQRYGLTAPVDVYPLYENAGRARLQGVTLSGAHRLGAVNLSGSLDLQQPKNADTGNLLARRAQRLLKLAADTRVAAGSLDWTLGAEWQAVSHRWDDAANTQRLGGYGLVNLYASTRIARQWDLLARIDNLGDKSYQLAQGYATAGRSFHLALRWAPRR